MARGFWILVWDEFGLGLNMINPRLLTDKDGNNWFIMNDKSAYQTATEIFGKLPKYHKIIEQ